MKSYLSLVPISARVRRKQSKMILLCIILAVFLVTTIVSLADALVKMETANTIDEGGYWHIRIHGIGEEAAEEIAMRSDVAASSWYDVINLDKDLTIDKEYYINGAQTALCGIEEPFIGEIMHFFSDGAHVTVENAIILTENAQELLGVGVGDTITLNTPAGNYDFTISGFRISGNGKYVGSNGGNTSALLVKDNQVGAFMNIQTFRKICSENGEVSDPQFYVRFRKHTNLRKALDDMKQSYGLTDSNIDLHTILMAASGIAKNPYVQNIYPVVCLLFLLILAAGVLMISGSMNSNVAQRLQFFGMLRCIGASRSQIIRIVRLEALNWCKTAVPIGCGLGVAATWTVSAGLKYFVGGELSDIPVFTVSVGGVLCGVAIGVVTVFLAAQAPAKRASKVSPMAAVSGNAGDTKQVKHAVNTHMRKIETALGTHHAVSAKKNLLLLTGSFALSIILFLSFSVLVEWIDCLLPQKASSPDIDIASDDSTNTIDASLLAQIKEIDGVAHAFGRRVCFALPAEFQKEVQADTIDLLSYDDYQLELLAKDNDLRKGSDLEKMYGDSHSALVIWDREMPLELGDQIDVGGETLTIVGMLKYSPFTNDGSTDGKINVIVNEETFARLTNITDYAIIDVQMASKNKDESNEAVEEIRRLSKEHVFRDRREESIASMYYAFLTFVYGFLAIIALIALLNIVNTISMSISARISQYGVMRAIGMGVGQLIKMAATEIVTYLTFGCVFGCVFGLPLSKYMYDFLITAHFYYAEWHVPVNQLVMIVSFIAVAAAVSIYTSAKRICGMRVTEMIHAL